jgi:hypothetical protein
MVQIVAMIGYSPAMNKKPSIGARFGSLVVWSLGFVGCATPAQQGFDEVAPGMTREEVQIELGEPSVRIPPRFDEQGVLLDGGRWQYADNLSSLANAAAFPDFVPDRVWVIWFDVHGVVQRTRRPIRVEDGTGEQNDDGGGTPLFPPTLPSRGR